MKRLAYIVIALVLCCRGDVAQPTRPKLNVVLREFYANKPNAEHFSNLNEAERWRFLGEYLPGRVFRVGPSAWLKFLPDGTGLFTQLVNYGTYEHEAIGFQATPGTFQWQIADGKLCIEPIDALAFGLQTEQLWTNPRWAEGVFRFDDMRGRRVVLVLVTPDSYLPPFFERREQFPLLEGATE